MDLALTLEMPVEIRPRLRPGERPAWWNASADHDLFESWRRSAEAAALSVDAWIATLVELHLSLADLPIRDPRAAVERAARLQTKQGDVAGLFPSLREWNRRDGFFAELDELPEIVLPQRLVSRLRPGSSLRGHLDPNLIDLALTCDGLATSEGRTLESWILSSVLRIVGADSAGNE